MGFSMSEFIPFWRSQIWYHHVSPSSLDALPKFERKHTWKQQFGRPFVVNIDLCIFSEFTTLAGNILMENHSHWNTRLTSFYPESTKLSRGIYDSWVMLNVQFDLPECEKYWQLHQKQLGASWDMRSQGPTGPHRAPARICLVQFCFHFSFSSLLATAEAFHWISVSGPKLKPWNIMDNEHCLWEHVEPSSTCIWWLSW